MFLDYEFGWARSLHDWVVSSDDKDQTCTYRKEIHKNL